MDAIHITEVVYSDENSDLADKWVETVIAQVLLRYVGARPEEAGKLLMNSAFNSQEPE